MALQSQAGLDQQEKFLCLKIWLSFHSPPSLQPHLHRLPPSTGSTEPSWTWLTREELLFFSAFCLIFFTIPSTSIGIALDLIICEASRIPIPSRLWCSTKRRPWTSFSFPHFLFALLYYNLVSDWSCVTFISFEAIQLFFIVLVNLLLQAYADWGCMRPFHFF